LKLARLPVRSLLWSGLLVVGLVAFALWRLPSPDYLFLPNTAQPLDGRVEVEGGADPPGTQGIYYLDVTIRHATWLEHILAFTRPQGASLLPHAAVVPQGSSFANETKSYADEMTRSEEVSAAVALRQAGYKVRARNTGVLVESVLQGIPAATVLQEGDVVVALDGKPTLTVTQLRARLAHVKPGRTVTVALRRHGSLLHRRLETVADPDDAGRTILGIYHAGQAADIHLPVRVTIDLGKVGGPSAGLSFALDVYQQLGHDIDNGHRVAATGELDLDGSVSPIGGVKQKTYGARRAGVDVLLMPAGDNANEARRYAGGMRVIPVESFQQALHALATLPRK